jgi:hypothetical protein
MFDQTLLLVEVGFRSSVSCVTVAACCTCMLGVLSAHRRALPRALS